MKFKNLSQELVVELLMHLAKNEDFASLKTLKAFSKEEVAEVLIEIAEHLKNEITLETLGQKVDFNNFDLSTQAQSLISCLSPREEMILFKSFKIE